MTQRMTPFGPSFLENKMKTCTKCKTKKEASDFGKARRARDELDCRCKECALAYRQSHKPERRVYDQVYYGTLTGRAVKLRSSKKQRLKYPEKKKAAGILNRAVATGKLKRSVFCESCGLPAKTDGHHSDYNKPLEVEWLCRKCHAKVREAKI